MPLPVHEPTKQREPRMEKIRLKMEMAAAEMLYSGRREMKGRCEEKRRHFTHDKNTTLEPLRHVSFWRQQHL